MKRATAIFAMFVAVCFVAGSAYAGAKDEAREKELKCKQELMALYDCPNWEPTKKDACIHLVQAQCELGVFADPLIMKEAYPDKEFMAKTRADGSAVVYGISKTLKDDQKVGILKREVKADGSVVTVNKEYNVFKEPLGIKKIVFADPTAWMMSGSIIIKDDLTRAFTGELPPEEPPTEPDPGLVFYAEFSESGDILEIFDNLFSEVDFLQLINDLFGIDLSAFFVDGLLNWEAIGVFIAENDLVGLADESSAALTMVGEELLKNMVDTDRIRIEKIDEVTNIKTYGPPEDYDDATLRMTKTVAHKIVGKTKSEKPPAECPLECMEGELCNVSCQDCILGGGTWDPIGGLCSISPPPCTLMYIDEVAGIEIFCPIPPDTLYHCECAESPGEYVKCPLCPEA